MINTLPTAGDALARCWRRMGRPAKTGFFAALLMGLAVYLFALTHQLFLTGDALNNYTFNGDLSWMGRWMLKPLSALGTDSNMPSVNGLIMILAISLTAGVTVSLLQIESLPCAAVTGALLMCHPAAAATLQYLHNADGYMIAALLATLALWLTDRHRLGFLPGAVLLCLSMGAYQAYLALVVSLMLVRGVSLMAQGDTDDRQLVCLLLRYVLLAALGIGLYYGTTKVLAALGMQLSEYQSVGSMGQFTPAQLLLNFTGCYRDFKESITFLSFRPGYYVNGYLNYALFAAGWGMMWLYCLTADKKPGQSRLLRLLLLAVLTLLSPMLYCAIRMANPQYVHRLMTYSTVGMYLLVVMAWQLAERRWGRAATADAAGAADAAAGADAVAIAADAEAAEAAAQTVAEAVPAAEAVNAAVPAAEAADAAAIASAGAADPVAVPAADVQTDPAPALLPRLWGLVQRLFTWAAPAALAVCLTVWSVGSNLDFYRGYEDYRNLYAQCSSYLTLAEQTPGYQKHMPVYVVGQPGEDSPLSRTRPGLNEIKSYYGFMVHVLKVQMPYGIANQIDEAALERADTDAFRQMPVYPLPGCATVIDGAMVIKLGEVN